MQAGWCGASRKWDPTRCSPLTLRNVAREDLEVIRSLAWEIWSDVYSPMLPPGQVEYMLKSRYSSGTLEAEIRKPTTKFFLLCLEGSPRGFASLQAGELPGVIMLDKLYLHPLDHGAGHGARALQLLEEIARSEMAGTGIRLRVNKSNGKAIRAYLRAGYAVTGRVCTDIGEGFAMDDYWMSKTLSTGTRATAQ